MDVQTPIICAGVVAVSAAVVYLSSILGIRERTYEEAIEEQRRRSSLETNVKTSKADKPKKDKKEKKENKKLNKKSKEKSSEPIDKICESKAQNKDNIDSVANRKPEHIEFNPEPEIVLLNDGIEQNYDYVRQRTPSFDKPIKPILTNKNEQYIDQFVTTRGNGQRNSFDQILPKDEFELFKESKKTYEKEITEDVVNEFVVKSDSEETFASVSFKADPKDPSEPEIIKNEVQKNENTDNSSPARRTKKSKQNQIEGNTKDVTAKTIIDLVKVVTLNNEEIQLLTNTLLNKQTDGSTEWRKKNDPVAMLKKQLQEKEIALEAEMKNLQAAVHKTRELRSELDAEKAKKLNGREKNQQLHQEVQALHIKLQQSFDNHRAELKAIQNQMQAMQGKMSDERSLMTRLQEENSRLNQLIKNDQHLKHEIEQLRSERQQFEMRIASNQKSNEELIRKNQHYENHIKTLADSRQKDDMSFQKHINDIKQELQKCESQRNTLAEELTHSTNKCNTFDADCAQLRKRYDELENNKNEEMKRLANQLSELNKEKTIIENALTEARHQKQNGEHKDEKELNKLNDELNSTKEELNNLRNALENQNRNNQELKEENRKALQSIDNLEKEKSESIRNALKASEDAYNNLKSETDILRQQNDSMNHKLAEAVDIKNLHIQEIELLKEALQQIFPSLDTKSDNWVSRIEITFNDLLSQRPIQGSNDEQTIHRAQELESLLETERQKSNELEVKLTEFKTTLSQTESILSGLQNKIENHDQDLEAREQKHENELRDRIEDNNKLREENKNLEMGLSQVQELRETISEMENKLKEFRSKLEGEENENKLWAAKYDEAMKESCELKAKLNQRLEEIETFGNDKAVIDSIKTECEELKASLEKEKKLSKDLNMQNVRLNSLVKIGHESLKLEEEKVKQLEAQINLNNGSANHCSPANGSPETNPLNSNSMSDSAEEAASVKK